MANSYYKNILYLIGGSSLTQALPILFSPVITRLFTPEDYGIQGLFIAVSGVLSVLVTSHYNTAIVIEPKEQRSFILTWICMLISVGVSLAALVVMLGVGDRLPLFSDLPKGNYWTLIIPFLILSNGFFTTLSSWENRHGRYKVIVRARIAQTMVTLALQLGLGYLQFGYRGLLLALLFGQAAGLLFLSNAIMNLIRTPFPGMRYLKYVSHRNRNYVLFAMPAEVISSLIQQVPVFFLKRTGSVSAVGLYGLVQRVIGIPSTIVGNSITEVFRRDAARQVSEHGHCSKLFNRTFKVLALTSIVPGLLVLLFGPQLFSLVFGEKWFEAGEFARILVPVFVLKYITSPLSYMYFIRNRQKEDLVLHILLLLSISGAFYLSDLLDFSVKPTLLLFSAAFSMVYLVFLFRSWQFSQQLKHD